MPRDDRNPDPRSVETRMSRRSVVTRAAACLMATAAVMPTTANRTSAQDTKPASSPIATPIATPDTMGVQLIAFPNPVRVDEPFDLGMGGLEPHQRVTLTSSYEDVRMEARAEATYEASSEGYVFASSQRPSAGTFDAADATGFIWGAVGPVGFPPGVAYTDPAPITITATDADDQRVLASTQINLTFLNDTTQQIDVREEGLFGTFFLPDVGDPVPAVLVLGGSEGGLNYWAEREAALFASHGFAALALAYFGIGDLPRTLDRIPIEYFQQALFWLQKQPGVASDRLGVMGTSRGAELALILGSMFDGVRAVVSIVGGGYVVGSPLDPGSPAWIWKGKPLPYVTEETADSRDLERVEVRVENINGPILLVSADADEIWPSTELSRVAWERLQRLGHPFADQFLSFPGAGHMIAPPYLPLTADTAKDPVAQQAANVGAWRATLQVFESRLKYG